MIKLVCSKETLIMNVPKGELTAAPSLWWGDSHLEWEASSLRLLLLVKLIPGKNKSDNARGLLTM